MRTIRTFIVRLLVDTDEPDALRGVVRCIASDSDHPFTDHRSLLEVLRTVSQPDPADPDSRIALTRGGA